MILFGCIFSILAGFIQANSDGQCIMRKNCDTDEISLLPKPCVYNGSPIPLNDSLSINILKELCPDLKPGPNFSVCCDVEQVENFNMEMETITVLFKHCPSCFHNLVNLFCQLVCSSTQSHYLKVTKSANNTVDEISYYIKEDFVTGLFDSCKDVKLGVTSNTAIEISCGSYGSQCKPHLWLEYLGSHGTSPYQINFHYETSDKITVGNETFYPMNANTIPCSQAVTSNGMPCSQADCP